MVVINSKIWINDLEEFRTFLEDHGFSNFRVQTNPMTLSVDIAFGHDSDALAYKLKDIENTYVQTPKDRTITANWRFDPDLYKDLEEALDVEDIQADVDNYIFGHIHKKDNT